MLETEQPTESSELHPSCSSDVKITDENDENFAKEEGKGNKPENYDETYKCIFDELVDDAMWELCFEIHRAVKLGYYFLTDSEKRKCQNVEDAEKDIFGQKLKSKVQTFQISCPICKNKSCATKFASHLAKCIGISGRTSSRAANKKIAASNVYSSDLDENEYDSDSSFNANKKRKKAQARKSSRKKAKVQGNSFSKSSSETNANYQEMTYEKRKAFFNQKCGVISKRTNKMCMNPHKCSQHSDEQRRDVRHFLLRDMGDQLANDGQIDVDTVDEGSGGFSFINITPPIPASSSSNKIPVSSPGFAGEKKNPTSQNKATPCKRKKTFDANNSASRPCQVARTTTCPTPTGSSFETT